MGGISIKIRADTNVCPEDFHSNGFDGVWDSFIYLFISSSALLQVAPRRAVTGLDRTLAKLMVRLRAAPLLAWQGHLPERHITVVLCSH